MSVIFQAVMIHRSIDNTSGAINTPTIVRYTDIIQATGLTVTGSHNVITIAAWRLSLQICLTAESCQFCCGLTYHSWQLWPGRQLGSPQCVFRITPADTCSVNRDVPLCGSSQWLKMTLQALLRCLSSLGSVQDVMTRPRCFGGWSQ